MTVLVSGIDETLSTSMSPRSRRGAWDPDGFGNRTLLVRKSMAVALSDPGWKLIVSKAKEEANGIEDIPIIFRYALGKSSSASS